MRKVEFELGAQQDIGEAFDWYDEHSPIAAEQFRLAVQEAAERAADRPTLYAPLDEKHRSCPLVRYPFRIIYQFDDTQLIVIAVAHSSRKPGYWRDRD